jgi:hypothetical protein
MSANSSPQMMSQSEDVETVDSNEKSLYKIGGVAALIIPGMYLIAAIINMFGYRAAPFPVTVIEWFTLFQNAPLTGLFYLGFADVIIVLLSGPLFLALYAALKRADKTWALIAATFAFVGMAVYLATNTAFSMLYLSHRYAAATTIEDKELILAAGQAILAVVPGTGGRYTGLPLVWVAGLIASAVMLRSENFNKVTTYAGILAFPLLLASIPFVHYTSTEPITAVESVIVFVSYLGGGVLSLVWYILVGLRLFRLGRSDKQTLSPQS